MARRRALTDLAVQKLSLPERGQRDHFDPSYPGLVVRASHGGRKTWVFMFRVGRRQRRMTLGTYPAMSLAEARQAWREARSEVEAGRDPCRVKERATTDVDGVVAEWLRRDQAKNRSAPQTARKIERHVLPVWGHRDITDIRRRDVLDLIDEIADRGAPVEARRVHAHLHRLFKWAVGSGIVESNPLQDLPKPGEEVPRDRVLSADELVAVWNAAGELPWYHGQIVRLLILTGTRREEVGQLRWSEVGDDRIELQGARTKNGKSHLIPLSAPARSILSELPHINGSDYVFTLDGMKPVTSWSRNKKELDKISGITGWQVRDLRRTVATGLQRLGVRIEVTEAVLNHVSGARGGIVGVYQTHDYLDEKREALEAWGAKVVGLVEGRESGKVVPLRAAP